jgi:uncharacterized membrane protein YgcG
VGFTKLDEDFFDSSLVDEGPIPVAIFVLLLSKAKADGIAHVAAPVVGNRLRLTPDQTAEGFRVLQAPDPNSRSLAHDGRRIERVDGGWLILNYQERRAKAHDESVREYERDRKRLQRQGMSGTPSGTSRDSYASASVSASGGEGAGGGSVAPYRPATRPAPSDAVHHDRIDRRRVICREHPRQAGESVQDHRHRIDALLDGGGS